MWYAAKQARPDETKHDKKLRDVRQTLKWLPVLVVIALFVAVLGIVRCVQHPDTEHLLDLIFPLGGMLFVAGNWRNARATLTGASDLSYGLLLLLGLLLMGSGPSLKDMWHHKQMVLFGVFGTAVAALTVFCVVMIVWEWVGSRQVKRKGSKRK